MRTLTASVLSLLVLLTTACGDGTAASGQEEAAAQEEAPVQEEDAAPPVEAPPAEEADDGDQGEAGGAFGVSSPCDEIFVVGRAVADVLAAVDDTFVCLTDEGETFASTFVYRCGARDTDVHYAMSPGPSPYGWGIDDEESVWQSWDEREPSDDCSRSD